MLSCFALLLATHSVKAYNGPFRTWISPNVSLPFYIVAPTSSYTAANNFLIWDLNEQTDYTGSDLNIARLSMSCVVNEFTSGDNIPYMYVFAGDTIYIERIVLDDDILTNDWEIVFASFTDNNIINRNSSGFDFDNGKFRHASIVSLWNFIYIWNAWDGGSGTDDWNSMFYYDTYENIIKFVGLYPETVCCSGFTYVNKSGFERLYTFGGYHQDDHIYYSNKVIYETSGPTVMPTEHPTSMPSLTPSKVPTTLPSTQPSFHPTSAPTSQPTSLPSNVPTHVPTQQPSELPTVAPLHDITRFTTTVVNEDSIDSITTTSADDENNNQNSDSSTAFGNSSVTIAMIAGICIVLVVCCLVLVCLVAIILPHWSKHREIGLASIQTQQKKSESNGYRVNANINDIRLENNGQLGSAATVMPQIGFSSDRAVEMAKLQSSMDNNAAGYNKNNIGGNAVQLQLEMGEGVSNVNMNETGQFGNNRNERASFSESNDNQGDTIVYEKDGAKGRIAGKSKLDTGMAQISIDGQLVEIDYKDLMQIVKLKQNDEMVDNVGGESL